MSYTTENKRPNPASMALAVGLNGSIILAVALSPVLVKEFKRDPFEGRSIPVEPLPPKQDEKQQDTDTKSLDPIYVPKPVNKDIPTDPIDIRTGYEETKGTVVAEGSGTGGILIKDSPPDPPAIFKAPSRDPRFARDFQPDYPPNLLQREIEGSATVRVLIGTDGRVREAQVVRATHPDFGKATVKQALKAWRFTPATRGDVAVEDWQTLSVRFTID